MQNRSKSFLLALLLAASNACTQKPSNVYDLDPNRQFWQGISVSQKGVIMDIMAPPHGGGIYFADYSCGQTIQIDPDAVPNLFAEKLDWRGHMAMAPFKVVGRLSYRNGEIVLRPASLKQLSSWKTGDDFKAYWEELRPQRQGLPRH